MIMASGGAEVIKEGWLQKRGEFIKNWRMRYFVLRSDGTFTGYKQGPIGLVYPEPLNYFRVEGISVIARDNIKKNAFMVRCLQMTTYVERIFLADTNEERLGWMDAIKKVAEDLNKKQTTLSNSTPVGEHIKSSNSSSGITKPSKIVTKDKGLQDYDMMKVLGRGTFGKVVLCRDKEDEKVYAMKILKKDYLLERDEMDHTDTERKVLKTMKHPFLTCLVHSFQTSTHICFVMEYVSGGELFYHLTKTKGFGEERARFYGAEITLAIGYLHENSVVYRDLKLENLLLDSDGHIKLTDFGLCKEDVGFGATTSTFCGTPEYLAPEVLQESDYGRAVDWWGLGVVLYEMICGRLPFYHRDQDQLFEAILNTIVKFPKNMSDNAKSCLAGLLEKDPLIRLGGGSGDAEDVKGHSFFSGISWQDLYNKKLKPPFKPRVEGEDDVSNFDPEFTEGENPSLTPPDEEADFSGI